MYLGVGGLLADMDLCQAMGIIRAPLISSQFDMMLHDWLIMSHE